MLSLATDTVEAPAAASSPCADAGGGLALCDDCGWQDCVATGFCLKPFVSPVALLGLPLTPLEAAQLLEEIAASPPRLVFLDVDLVVEVTPLNTADAMASVSPLATACLTGVDEDPAVAVAMPAAPSKGDGGISLSEFSAGVSPSSAESPVAGVGTAPAARDGTPASSTAFPATAGTTC